LARRRRRNRHDGRRRKWENGSRRKQKTAVLNRSNPTVSA